MSRRGYISIDDIKNAPELSDEIKPPKKERPLYRPPKGHYKELTKDFWNGDKLITPPEPSTGWIDYGEGKIEVGFYEGSRRVFWKRDKDGKKLYYWDTYTSWFVLPDGKKWDKDGNLIEATDDRGTDHHVADILNPIEEEKKDVKPATQLQLF